MYCIINIVQNQEKKRFWAPDNSEEQARLPMTVRLNECSLLSGELMERCETNMGKGEACPRFLGYDT